MSRHGLKASFGLSLSGPQYGSALLSSGMISTPPFDKGVGRILFQLCVDQNPLLRKAKLLEEAYQVPLAANSNIQHKVENLLQILGILPFHDSRMIYNHKYQF